MNVDHMLRCITMKQFREWEVFAILEPFDEERADQRAAGIAQVMGNIWRGKNKSAQPLEKYVVRFGDSVEPSMIKQSWQKLKALGRSIASSYKNDG